MNKWTLTKIIRALKKLSERGWIESSRIHDTGIGKTLEDELNIKENNIALPDFGVMELKSQRSKTNSMVTLFTKKPEGITNKEIREKYGYPDKHFSKVKCLRQTIADGRKNAQGFSLSIDKKKGIMWLIKDGERIGFYYLDFLKEKAIEKIGDGLILVLAETKKEKGKEFFRSKKAYLLKGIDSSKFIKHSKYDIRLGVYKSGSKRGLPHDHGSAFRIPNKDIQKLFRISSQI